MGFMSIGCCQRFRALGPGCLASSIVSYDVVSDIRKASRSSISSIDKGATSRSGLVLVFSELGGWLDSAIKGVPPAFTNGAHDFVDRRLVGLELIVLNVGIAVLVYNLQRPGDVRHAVDANLDRMAAHGVVLLGENGSDDIGRA